jgi:hypothetical protein
MQSAESVVRYRSYAAKCVRVSRNIPDPTGKLVLLEMAQSWLKLAEHAAEGADPALAMTLTSHQPRRRSTRAFRPQISSATKRQARGWPR